jgi:acyl-CoA thioester hydrolase
MSPNREQPLNDKQKKWQAETIIEVPFHDVDMMEIVWHGHYAKYFEVARCVLLDKLGYNYRQMRASGYAWPVIDMHIRYPGPVKFGQKIRVQATIVEWESRLKIKYVIVDVETGQRLTKGHTIQVAVKINTKEMCFVSPSILLEKLQEK